jgi:hypothetical protein
MTRLDSLMAVLHNIYEIESNRRSVAM